MAAMPATRVVIAEPEGLVRAGLRFLLERQEGISVVAEVATADEALAAAAREQPDVVLMTVPGAVAATRRIRSATATSVLLLMSNPADDAVFAALRAGATGVLLRDADPDALVEAVRVVAAGETLLAPSVAGRVVEDLLSRPERLHSTPEQLDELTPREREVSSWSRAGSATRRSPHGSWVTRATAKTHVSRSLRKLHARDRAQLVALAYESGLVRPGPRLRVVGSTGRPSLRPVAA